MIAWGVAMERAARGTARSIFLRRFGRCGRSRARPSLWKAVCRVGRGNGVAVSPIRLAVSEARKFQDICGQMKELRGLVWRRGCDRAGFAGSIGGHERNRARFALMVQRGEGALLGGGVKKGVRTGHPGRAPAGVTVRGKRKNRWHDGAFERECQPAGPPYVASVKKGRLESFLGEGADLRRYRMKEAREMRVVTGPSGLIYGGKSAALGPELAHGRLEDPDAAFRGPDVDAPSKAVRR